MKIILFIFLLLGLSAESQNQDVNYFEIEKKAKFHVLRLESTHGVIEVDKFCIVDSLLDSRYFESKTLEQSGFKNYIFIEVSFAEVDFFEYYTKGISVENLFFNQFILAYDKINRRFFKLKGFLNNEFPLFYKSLILKSDLKTQKILMKKNKKSAKYFRKNYYVNNLDFEVLIENIDNINNWKIKSLLPSSSRLFVDQNGYWDFL